MWLLYVCVSNESLNIKNPFRDRECYRMLEGEFFISLELRVNG